MTGRSVRTTWCARRTWKHSRVVSEYHYAHRQDGEPLSLSDVRIAASSNPEPVHPLIEKALASKVPIAELIGFRVDEIGDGRAVSSLRSGPQHANPMGTLHGGVLCDLADAAMGIAFVTTLAADESFTTMGLSINFFRPVWQAELRAEARVVNRGKTVRRQIISAVVTECTDDRTSNR